MAYNFLPCDRDQPFLLPPDLRDWLSQNHLAWFILDVLDQLDLAPFYRAHRADGHGHPAYDPKTLLGVLLYAYCIGVRSSRQIQRRCTDDIAFRVLAANQTPDHVTIVRFRVRHQQALAGFLVASLKLCAAAGMVRVATVALDGTKLAGNANRTLDRLDREVAEILRQAAEADQRENFDHGQARGDLLPATKSRSCETLEYPAASSSASTQAAQGRSAPVKLTKKSRSTLARPLVGCAHADRVVLPRRDRNGQQQPARSLVDSLRWGQWFSVQDVNA
jgi:transposase